MSEQIMDYKQAGVDIKKGEQFTTFIKNKVSDLYDNRVYSGIDGFSALYEITKDKLLSAGTDGVGTKIKIAQQLEIHDTIGIDLVAMCVNDILCCGATPLFFMDYIATSHLKLNIAQPLLMGIKHGCQLAKIPLIGGETAEMPDLYQNNDYDLAGFAVGEVLKKDLIDGKKLQENDSIIALSASGFHANGFSLIRKLVEPGEFDLLEALLTPTKIYADTIKTVLNKMPHLIKGMAHITGGGVHNIGRINLNFNYILDNLPDHEEISPLYAKIQQRAKLPQAQL